MESSDTFVDLCLLTLVGLMLMIVVSKSCFSALREPAFSRPVSSALGSGVTPPILYLFSSPGLCALDSPEKRELFLPIFVEKLQNQNYRIYLYFD